MVILEETRTYPSNPTSETRGHADHRIPEEFHLCVVWLSPLIKESFR